MRRNQIQLYYIMSNGVASEFDAYDRMDLYDFHRLHQSFIKKKNKEKKGKDGAGSNRVGSKQR